MRVDKARVFSEDDRLEEKLRPVTDRFGRRLPRLPRRCDDCVDKVKSDFQWRIVTIGREIER